MSGAAPHPLRLAFPGTGRPSIEFAPRPDGACVVLGRPSAADAPPDVPLQDASVSRRHAEFAVRGGAWHVRSLGKGGTALEGRLLGHEEWVPLPDASTLAVGPYRIRVVVGDARSGAALGETIAFAEATEGPRPEAVSRQRLESAEVRLSALLAAARRIDACDDEQSLADAAVSVLIDTRDFDRAAVVRAGAVGDRDGWVPLAIAASNEPARSLPVSRTLLEEARSTNGMVRLDQSMARMNLSASIMASGATAAICVPIPSAVPPRLFLYADTRGGGALGDAAVPFADMVAQLAGALALGRRAPGAPGPRPSGDFFTVLEADGGRVAAFIGDVAGKGAGAAIVMASSVAHLDAAVRHGLPIEQALSGVSEYFVRRPNLDLSVSTGGFSTAIAVEIMPDGSCRGVDAAHCYAAVVRADGAAERLDFPNRTTMIGYAEGIELVADEFRLAPGDRLVLFSDGVGALERFAAGGELGLPRHQLGVGPGGVVVVAVGGLAERTAEPRTERDLRVRRLGIRAVGGGGGEDDFALLRRHLQGVGLGVVAVLQQVGDGQHCPDEHLLVVLAGIVAGDVVAREHRQRRAGVVRLHPVELVADSAEQPLRVARAPRGEGHRRPVEGDDRGILRVAFGGIGKEALGGGQVAAVERGPDRLEAGDVRDAPGNGREERCRHDRPRGPRAHPGQRRPRPAVHGLGRGVVAHHRDSRLWW